MKLPPFFTTVTSFSKILAAVLFVILPFAGFYLGMEYQKGTTSLIMDNGNSQVPIIITPSPTIDQTVYTEGIGSENWKTYTNKRFGYQIKYPSNWEINSGPVIEGKGREMTKEELSNVERVEFFRLNSDTNEFLDPPVVAILVDLSDSAQKISCIDLPEDKCIKLMVDMSNKDKPLQELYLTNGKFYFLKSRDVYLYYYSLQSSHGVRFWGHYNNKRQDWSTVEDEINNILSTFKFLD